jgi:hypothetical protein
MPRGGRRVSTNKKGKKEPDQNDPLLPRCLGWCGSKRFKPKFKWDRCCTKCTAIKRKNEVAMSRIEERATNTSNGSLPEIYDDY